MFFQRKVNQFARWMGQSGRESVVESTQQKERSSSGEPARVPHQTQGLGLAGLAALSPLQPQSSVAVSNRRGASHSGRQSSRYGERRLRTQGLSRQHLLEAMEPRYMMAADVIQIGAVYVEEDLGSDLHGDLFYITFQGGAENTQLNRVTIDGDLNEPGFGLGDVFFDTLESGLGGDHAFPFQIEDLQTANPNATVTATVEDGTSLLVLNFTDFVAGDRLIFSIDVDEVQFFDPNESDTDILNEGFDPVTSGIEFQNTKLFAEFSAPHYEIASGQDRFINLYDRWLSTTTLDLPEDNFEGKRDRSAGGGFDLQQVPKPVSLSGTVYVDSNEDLTLQPTEQRLGGVRLDLYVLENGTYVATGNSTTTDSQGRYEFGTNLGLQPGTYQVRESQPDGYYSVGATPGQLDGRSIGAIVAGNPDVLTEVNLLKGDQHATELNFAENLPASISGHVCYVISGSDCFSEDAVKAPLEGVLIELRDESGTVIATDITAADGTYEFIGLRAGTYSLTEITPPEFLEGSAKPGSVGGILSNGSLISQIIIGGGTNAINYDFCELTPSELSGHTYFDANNNGVRNPGESPLSNVLIQLYNEAGVKVAETRTDSQGFYIFRRLPPGQYRVTEQTPAGYLPGQADVGTIGGARVGTKDSTGDVLAEIMLPVGASGINYDFGEILPGSISGQVIVDSNGNCIIDAAGEMPLPGVRIELLNANGFVIETTFTDANGEYEFDNLVPGRYSVRETQPDGYFHGDQSAGSGGGNDSVADLISQIDLAPGAELVDYDFCELPPGSIAGSVYVDIDQDCIYDPDEAPIAGVTIRLFDENGTLVATTQTDANGDYEFRGLRPGNYTVRETQPAGFLQGSQRAGSGGGNDSVQDSISAITLGAGVSLVDYDFCEWLPATLSGSVYVDTDFDCVRDPGEAPIQGVTITLLDANGNVVATTLTDANGNYEFTDLTPGTYTVRETQPVGYFHGGQVAGSGGGDDTARDIISGISITAGMELVDYDFCELLPGSISGSVFVDLDFDCFQDSNEESLAGVRIDLINDSGNIVATAFTDSNGEYTFGNLRPGNYTVRETQPVGFFHGGQVAPASRSGGSQPNGNDSLADVISNIFVGSNEAITEANFCEQPPAAITGYVFQDGPVIVNATGEVPADIQSIRDGARTADDTPIGGVTVSLYLVTGSPAPISQALPGTYSGETIEVQTDANGFFQFVGLRAATYVVLQTQPENYVDAIDTPGTTSGLAFNSETELNTFFGSSVGNTGLRRLSDQQLLDAILFIELTPGQISEENNFSEVLARPMPPPPPPEDPPETFERITETPPLYAPAQPLAWQPLLWEPLPLLVGVGFSAPKTWHLSIINGGYPRGLRSGDALPEEVIAENAESLDVYEWSIKDLSESTLRIAQKDSAQLVSARRAIFDIPNATPIAGDFNGDGYDELALFLDGEWFIDANGNGRWDAEDIWLKMGQKGDQPVVSDWDGDGKDDVGIFGRKWRGDERALAAETGLPDPENMSRIKPKNLPPAVNQAPDTPRLLKRSHQAEARADLIDHVFQFGSDKDIAISGDFNGDGIGTIGVFSQGKWTLDVNGDGRLTDEHDEQHEFGEAGDLPLVGDFDGDGIDDLAIVRGNEVIVDSNKNGYIDATDQVFELEGDSGDVIVGDFDGDGVDEPATREVATRGRMLQARLP